MREESVLFIVVILIAGLLVLVLSGCARTRIKKVTDDANAEGLRFYQPAPYLLVEARIEAASEGDSSKQKSVTVDLGAAQVELKAGDRGEGENTESGQLLTASKYKAAVTYTAKVIWLPDYSRQFAIEQHGCFGKADLNVTLTDGWNLTSLNAVQEYKPGEEVKAILEGVGALAVLPSDSADVTLAAQGKVSLEPVLYQIVFDRTKGYIQGLRRVETTDLREVPPEDPPESGKQQRSEGEGGDG